MRTRRGKAQEGRLYEIPCMIAFVLVVIAIVVPPCVNAIHPKRAPGGDAPAPVESATNADGTAGVASR